jgi:hypothetical protein
VTYVHPKAADLANYSASALTLVIIAMEKKLVLNKYGCWEVPSSIGCQHLRRKKTFEYLL